MNSSPAPMTLGRYIQQARKQAGFSLRQLTAITGFPRMTLNRLELDQIDNPSPALLQRVAEALELNSDDLFAFVGYRPSASLPSLAPYLRAKYHLPPEAIARASETLRELLDKYNGPGVAE